MPGIAGIIGSRLLPEDRAALNAMLGCLLHEDFYESGTFFSEESGLAVGWASHPGSFSEGMPIWNEDRTVCLIFTGEDYQDRLAVNRSLTPDHQLGSQPGGYLVHLYEEIGLKFLERLNGWFSGLILDLRKAQAFLFNDRYGIGRICYHEHEGKFYFSSEAKSLLKILPHLRSLDLKSLGEIFSCGSVLQNRTLFSGISLLPGGSIWSFWKSRLPQKERYFEPRLWEELPVLSETEYDEQLKATWQRILPRYFPENGHVGLSLTGGVDSRMVLAWAPCPPGRLPCYTFSGRYRDCNDVKLARRLAKLARQPYQTIPIDGVFMSEFSSLVERVAYISEGNLDASGSIDLFVQREARKIAPIRVTGTNGGEVLRRLVMFKPSDSAEEMLNSDMRSYLSEAVSTYTEELNCHRLTFTAFKQTPWYMNSKFALERSQIRMQVPFCDDEMTRLSYQAPPSLAQANSPALKLIAGRNPAFGSVETDRALQFESSSPVRRFRHLVQEFSFKAEYAYDVGMPHWLARADRILAPIHLENVILGRHKFHHFRVYYRDELAGYLQEILLDARALGRPFLNRDSVQEMILGHVRGYRNYTSEIHRLLSIELMLRQLVD